MFNATGCGCVNIRQISEQHDMHFKSFVTANVLPFLSTCVHIVTHGCLGACVESLSFLHQPSVTVSQAAVDLQH